MSLVTYDSYVNLVFGLTKMDKVNKEKAKSFVKAIRDGSSTNLCGGLLKGMNYVTIHIPSTTLMCEYVTGPYCSQNWFSYTKKKLHAMFELFEN